MTSSTTTDAKAARKAIDLYVRLIESLRADGYGQDVIEELTVEHLVALVHGELREPDGSADLPIAASRGPGSTNTARLGEASLELMDELLHELLEVTSLANRQLLSSVVMGIGWKAYAQYADRRT